MKKTLLIFSLFFVLQNGQSQIVVDVSPNGSFSALTLTLLTGVSVENGVNLFRVQYEMEGIDGNLDTVSGLLCIPILTNAQNLPVVVYQHPTSSSGRNDVPSSGGFSIGAFESIGYSAFGFLVFATDYLGLGDSRGFHPFVHAESEANAGFEMIRACLEYLETRTDVSWDGKNMFLSGYSQGGHSSMALHQKIESDPSETFSVAGATHMAGPYSLSDVMLDKFLSDSEVMNVADMVFMILGYQSWYGTIYDSIPQVFKAPYDSIIANFYEQQYALTALEAQLGNALLVNEDTIVAKLMLQDSFLMEMLDTMSEVRQLVQQNDTYNWAPNAPTRLIYCGADERVPPRNATLADSVMNALGATDLISININATAGHGDCALFSLLASIEFFNNWMLPVSTKDLLSAQRQFEVFPNPANDRIWLAGPADAQQVEIHSSNGELVQRITGYAQSIDLSIISPGYYVLRIWSDSGIESHPFVVQRN